MHVLITGAEQGLGQAILRRLASSYGAVTVLNLPGDFLRNVAYSSDIAERIKGHPFDIVINNFGINHISRIGETPDSDGDILHLNVLIPYWITNCLAQSQPEHPTRMLNIASQTYRVPQRTTALYCASKAALVQLTKVIAREMAPHWVANAFAPGRIVGTEMDRLTQAQVVELRKNKWVSQEAADDYARSLIPMQRFTTVEEMAEAAIQILRLPEYITGTVIEAMGGV